MATENDDTIKNTSPEYSEMLLKLVDEFEKELPENLTFEDTLEIGIDAWNLANRKPFLEDKELYKQELKSVQFRLTFEKMVNYKIKKFPEANQMIVDYTIIDNKPQVEIQTYEVFFNNLITQLIITEEENND